MSNVVALFPNRPPPEPEPTPAPVVTAAPGEPVERVPHVPWWGLLLALPLRWVRPLVRLLAGLLAGPSLLAAVLVVWVMPPGERQAVALVTCVVAGLGSIGLAVVWDMAIQALESPR